MALPFEVANFNLVNFANDYNNIFDSTPADVAIQVKDSNGNVSTKTVANRGKFKQQLWDDVGGALGQLVRTFYVDSISGDDNNDGSSNNPFKTLQKASNSIPHSGFGTVFLVSDYNGTFNIDGKDIFLIINNDVTFTIPQNSRCILSNCSFTVKNNVHIIIDSGDGSGINGDNYAGFFVTNGENGFLSNPVNFYLVNKSNDPLVVDAARCFFGSRAWGNNQNILMSLAVYNINSSGNIVLDGNILQLHNGCGSFQYTNYSGSDATTVDSSDNAVDINTKVAGIIKDTNGIPRNIQSNLTL